MDTRDNQFEEELKNIKETVKQQDSDELILKINNLKLDNQFKDSIIFNLAQKMDVKAVMEKVYLNELETVESYPQQLKYYVHFPCINIIKHINTNFIRFVIDNRSSPWNFSDIILFKIQEALKSNKYYKCLVCQQFVK
ncbi:hypothetical protein ABPG72_010802 [Tetrahymena utriculariae]